MSTVRRNGVHPSLVSLEAAAVSARAGFACMFSSSDEYETALIAQRRAQGRYAARPRRWPVAVFAGCVLIVAGAVVLLA